MSRSQTFGPYRHQGANSGESSSSSGSSGSSSSSEEEEKEEEPTPPKLTNSQIKQFYLDLKERGGIYNPSLNPSELYNSKRDIYGEPNTKFRRRFRNKLDRWKTTLVEEYNDLRVKYGAPYNEFSSTNLTHLQQTEQPQSLPEPTNTQSRRTPSHNRQQSTTFQSPPSSVERSARIRTTRFTPSSFDKMPATNSGIQSLITEHRDVNLRYPEENGGKFVIQAFTDKVHGEFWRDGFDLTKYGVDWRELKEEVPRYAAWQTDTNKVVVKEPTTEYGYLVDVAAEAMGKKLRNLEDECIDGATSITRNQISEDETRQFKYVEYTFPSPLDNSVFSADATNGEITPQVIPVYVEYDGVNQFGQACKCRQNRPDLSFKIALFEDPPRKVGTTAKPKPKNPLSAQLEEITSGLASSNIGSPLSSVSSISPSMSVNTGPLSPVASPAPAADPGPTPAPAPAPASGSAQAPASAPRTSVPALREHRGLFKDNDLEERGRQSHKESIKDSRKSRKQKQLEEKRTKPSSLQLAATASTETTSSTEVVTETVNSTEQVVFGDGEAAATDNDGVLLQGDPTVWKTDSHDEVVAVHPHTQEQVTVAGFHKIITDLAAESGKTNDDVLNYCKAHGAGSFQDCLGILFPAQAV